MTTVTEPMTRFGGLFRGALLPMRFPIAAPGRSPDPMLLRTLMVPKRYPLMP
jgi:hypothetical protein